MRLRWVFFDVGNVLLEEDPLSYRNFLRHAEAVGRARPGMTFFDVLQDRERYAAAGSKWPLHDAVAAVLTEEECALVWDATSREVRDQFAALSPVIVGAAEAIARLAETYRLGLIANQGRECRLHLQGLGLLEKFEVVAFAEEVGCFKPDPALFRAALKTAGAEPGECLMVGDRLDNDIIPASELGMKTCWVRWPRREAKGWNPREHEAQAYIHSLKRISARLAPPRALTLMVDAIGDVAEALLVAQKKVANESGII